MVFEILKATFLGSLPVMIFTFLILQWSIRSGRLQAFDGDATLRQQYKDQIKAQKAETKAQKAEIKEAKKKAKAEARKASRENKVLREVVSPAENNPLFSKKRGGDMMHNKIMSFGGGFYGTMAVLTYILIELIEIWQFLGKIFGPGSLFDNIGINMLVAFIINSVMNFVSAMLWFKTLGDYLPVGNGWIWLGAAYLGYITALKLVTHHGNDIWEKIHSFLPTPNS